MLAVPEPIEKPIVLPCLPDVRRDALRLVDARTEELRTAAVRLQSLPGGSAKATKLLGEAGRLMVSACAELSNVVSSLLDHLEMYERSRASMRRRGKPCTQATTPHGQLVDQAMAALGCSQRELAGRVGCSHGVLSRAREGRIRSAETVRKLREFARKKKG